MKRQPDTSQAEEILEGADASLLEIIDHVLNKGVMVHGEVVLGVAGVDLVYLRLSAMLCAADKLLPASNAGLRTERASDLRPQASGLRPEAKARIGGARTSTTVSRKRRRAK